ncbi:hypothetical protein [Halosimplex amylolyticum]|uniref:hypothetical protein n=1 Tax=Halosimplex amylolyticum TaxID=3396616 RepID=UPI003F563B9C
MPDDDSTERVVMLQRLDPDHVNDYLEAHEDISQGVSDAMGRAEFRNSSYWFGRPCLDASKSG